MTDSGDSYQRRINYQFATAEMKEKAKSLILGRRNGIHYQELSEILREALLEEDLVNTIVNAAYIGLSCMDHEGYPKLEVKELME